MTANSKLGVGLLAATLLLGLYRYYSGPAAAPSLPAVPPASSKEASASVTPPACSRPSPGAMSLPPAPDCLPAQHQPSMTQAEFATRQQQLLQALTDHLRQQLRNGDDFLTLQQMLPDAQSRAALTLALQQLQAERAKKTIPQAKALAEMERLSDIAGQFQALSDDNKRQQAIAAIKNSPLFQQNVLADNGLLSAFSARGVLLSMLIDHPTLAAELQDVRLHPTDYLFGLRTISPDTLQLLLKHSDGLSTFQYGGLNLADVAVLFLRPDLLPVLAQHQLEPTDLPGHFSALDLAFVAPEWQTAAKHASPTERRIATIRYLQARGYSLHASKVSEQPDKPSLLIPTDWFADQTEPALATVMASVSQKSIEQADLVALTDGYPLTEQQNIMAPAPLQALLVPLQALRGQFYASVSDCQPLSDTKRSE